MDLKENKASNYSSIVTYVSVAAVTFLSSRYVATLREFTYTHRLMGFFKYIAAMGSVAIVYRTYYAP
jgi:hypothetical protein